MNPPTDSILNGLGDKYMRRSGTVRADRTTIIYMGTEITVDYRVHGAFLSATETDDYEAPTCEILGLEINGADVMRLLDSHRDQIAEQVEWSWRGGV